VQLTGGLESNDLGHLHGPLFARAARRATHILAGNNGRCPLVPARLLSDAADRFALESPRITRRFNFHRPARFGQRRVRHGISDLRGCFSIRRTRIGYRLLPVVGAVEVARIFNAEVSYFQITLRCVKRDIR